MKCSKCNNKAIFPNYCKEHFIDYFENKIKNTIKDFNLINKNSKICVAASGGKDSLTVLYVLKKFGYDITALIIDEGINNYREHTKKDLQIFCKQHNIKLKITSFKELTGKKLDKIMEDKTLHPCTVCGTFRRYLLNKHSKGFNYLATGHNADDESQAVLMNLFRANTALFPRGGPKTGTPNKGFVQRIKPLYFCTEKEIMTYAILNNLTSNFTECPYVNRAYRASVRDVINGFAIKHPKIRENILRKYLELKNNFSLSNFNLSTCNSCGEPSSGDLCSACKMLIKIK